MLENKRSPLITYRSTLIDCDQPWSFPINSDRLVNAKNKTINLDRSSINVDRFRSTLIVLPINLDRFRSTLIAWLALKIKRSTLIANRSTLIDSDQRWSRSDQGWSLFFSFSQNDQGWSINRSKLIANDRKLYIHIGIDLLVLRTLAPTGINKSTKQYAKEMYTCYRNLYW